MPAYKDLITVEDLCRTKEDFDNEYVWTRLRGEKFLVNVCELFHHYRESTQIYRVDDNVYLSVRSNDILDDYSIAWRTPYGGKVIHHMDRADTRSDWRLSTKLPSFRVLITDCIYQASVRTGTYRDHRVFLAEKIEEIYNQLIEK